MPPIATNEEIRAIRDKAAPHVRGRADLAAAMDAQMRFTCATASGVARIDCVSSIPGPGEPMRAVIAIMPVPIRWENAAAIDFHPNSPTAA